MSIRERYVRYLLAHSYSPVGNSEEGYALFRRIFLGGESQYYHVNTHGTLRYSGDGLLKHSRLSRSIKADMVKWEDVNDMEV